MKDSYSFDIDDAGLDLSYQKHRDAYVKTFDRLGIKYNIVRAVSGAMGGSKSEEFLAPCPTGEDTYVLCPSCGFAANVEAMITKVDAVDSSATPAMEELDTRIHQQLIRSWQYSMNALAADLQVRTR